MDVEELASRLALTGTEVERVAHVGVPGDSENLERFLVGKVLDCRRHPDADKLSVCIVDVGEGARARSSAAPPMSLAGQTVAVVLPGGVMPDGTRIRDAQTARSAVGRHDPFGGRTGSGREEPGHHGPSR